MKINVDYVYLQCIRINKVTNPLQHSYIQDSWFYLMNSLLLVQSLFFELAGNAGGIRNLLRWIPSYCSVENWTSILLYTGKIRTCDIWIICWGWMAVHNVALFFNALLQWGQIFLKLHLNFQIIFVSWVKNWFLSFPSIEY